jgi:hypothetical protein
MQTFPLLASEHSSRQLDRTGAVQRRIGVCARNRISSSGAADPAALAAAFVLIVVLSALAAAAPARRAGRVDPMLALRQD